MYSQEIQVLSSSDDEMDVVPLKMIQSRTPEPLDDLNSYVALYKYSMEKCEFCESIFHCRYDAIIHNAKHIIVPLINQTTYKCLICLHVFTSEKELHYHKFVKHNLATAPQALENFFRKEISVKNNTVTAPIALQSYIRNESTVKKNTVTAPMVLKTYVRNISSVKKDTVPAHITLQKCVGNESAVQNVNEPAPIVLQSFIRNKIADKNVNVPAPIDLKNFFRKEITVRNKTVPATIVSQSYVRNESRTKTVPATVVSQSYVRNESADKNVNVPAPINIKKENPFNSSTILRTLLNTDQAVECVDATMGLKSNINVFSSGQDLYHHKYAKQDLAAAPKVMQSFRHETVFNKNDNVPIVLENIVKTEPVDSNTCDDAMMVTKSNLKNRLVFEEDDDDDKNKNVSDFDSNVNNLILDIANDKLEKTLNGVENSKEKQQTTSEKKQQTTPQPEVPPPIQVNIEKFSPSVPYQQLIKPGLYWCKRCTKITPTRYSQILHETEHMMLKKQVRSSLCTICDRHIAGNHHVLRKHRETVHPYVDVSRNRSVSVCKQCNLKFHNSLRHSTNYHAIFSCDICHQYFSKSLLTTHYEECKNSSASVKTSTDNGLQKKDVVKETLEEPPEILKVCEVCASFLKDNSSFKYICVGENSKLQCDQICEQCNNKAYVIKLIKRVRNNLKVGSQYKVKTLSNNENRLKNIQQRLKLMNQLSRC